MAQCTIFSFEGAGRPRTLAVGDRARTRALPDISQAYVQRFYRLDGAQLAMQAHHQAALKASPQQPHIVLHRQAAHDVQHPDYRQICYEWPRVAERLAILSLHEGRRWLSVNLYRGLEHGLMTEPELATVQALAMLEGPSFDAAPLLDAFGRHVGHHGAGPHWQAHDGSRLLGKVRARVCARNRTGRPRHHHRRSAGSSCRRKQSGWWHCPRWVSIAHRTVA